MTRGFTECCEIHKKTIHFTNENWCKKCLPFPALLVGCNGLLNIVLVECCSWP